MTHFIYAKKDLLITPSTFKGMLIAADKPWVKSLLVYLYVFGVRICEAIQTNREDLVIEKLDGIEYLVANSPTAKNKKIHNRRLYAPTDTPYIDILLNYLGAKPGSLRRFMGTRLWPYSRGWAWRKITNLNKEISPHVFRHNRLTRLARAEATAFQIQSFAGHSDLRPASAYVQISGVMTLRMAQKIKIT